MKSIKKIFAILIIASNIYALPFRNISSLDLDYTYSMRYPEQVSRLFLSVQRRLDSTKHVQQSRIYPALFNSRGDYNSYCATKSNERIHFNLFNAAWSSTKNPHRDAKIRNGFLELERFERYSHFSWLFWKQMEIGYKVHLTELTEEFEDGTIQAIPASDERGNILQDTSYEWLSGYYVCRFSKKRLAIATSTVIGGIAFLTYLANRH